MEKFMKACIHIGHASTVALWLLVLHASDWDWTVCLWMIPLTIGMQLGCFALRDLKHLQSNDKANIQQP